MRIEKAKNIDNIEISVLTAWSKAHWNYSSEQIEKWKDDLTISFEYIYLDSDPNAEKFYQNLGFKVVGQLESSIKNRFLPIMELEIEQISTLWKNAL